jgi:hypothetical protein
MLWCAARLAPAGGRSEWLAEWQAELCHVRGCRGARQTFGFCAGAFRDALWLRRHAEAGARRALIESPVRTLALLAILASAAVLVAVRLPAARAIVLPGASPEARRLVMVAPGDNRAVEIPSMSPAAYQWLAAHGGGAFTGAAFYRRRDRARGLIVGLASANLFEVMGVSMDERGTLVLSDRTWRRLFHRDPRIVGRTVTVAGETGVVRGVLKPGLWQLPGGADVWLLEDGRAAAGGPGFVVARLAEPLPESWWSFRLLWPVRVAGAAGAYECYLPASASGLLLAHLAMLGVGVLMASIGRSFSFGAHGGDGKRRWMYLAAKLALLPAVVGCGAADLAAVTSPGLLAPALIVGYTVALRWALADQRSRCPVCLRVLIAPTRIGGASHAFLEWYGTELICRRGHGRLQVPEIRTSSYGTERWFALDSSWRDLFLGTPR